MNRINLITAKQFFCCTLIFLFALLASCASPLVGDYSQYQPATIQKRVGEHPSMQQSFPDPGHPVHRMHLDLWQSAEFQTRMDEIEKMPIDPTIDCKTNLCLRVRRLVMEVTRRFELLQGNAKMAGSMVLELSNKSLKVARNIEEFDQVQR